MTASIPNEFKPGVPVIWIGDGDPNLCGVIRESTPDRMTILFSNKRVIHYTTIPIDWQTGEPKIVIDWVRLREDKLNVLGI
jgi:hypothetical protein